MGGSLEIRLDPARRHSLRGLSDRAPPGLRRSIGSLQDRCPTSTQHDEIPCKWLNAGIRSAYFPLGSTLRASSLDYHLHHMRAALALAQRAFWADEVPVGAVVVLENTIIGRGYNRSLG